MSDQAGFYAAVSGAIAQEKRLDILANNLANVNTAGFKKDVLSFEALLAAAEQDGAGADLVALSRHATDFSQGGARHTGNALDLAVRGGGFFEVLTADGPRYTRAGSFTLDGSGRLVTEGGDPVSGGGGPVLIDGGDVVVGADGEVTVDGESVGQIKLVSFVDPGQLEKVGANLFRNAGEAGNIDSGGVSSIQQGYLEMSNVNIVSDMVQMIEISRAYESFQKTIQSIDSATQKLVNEVGKG